MSVEDLITETVGRVADTGVDTLICHAFAFGCQISLWDTAIEEAKHAGGSDYDYVQLRNMLEKVRDLLFADVDPWNEVIKAGHKEGLDVFLSIRMLAVHPRRHYSLLMFE